MPLNFNGLKIILLLASIALLTSCAHGPNANDPYEHFNRNTYRLNDKVDDAVLKPAAKGYRAAVPYSIRKSVSNFFSNINETVNIGNDIMQGRAYWAFNDTWRFLVNTTVGIGGLFDPASHIGLVSHQNDFSLTLDSWGYKHPAYVVIPFFGPSTEAGVIALPVDFVLVPWRVQPEALQVGLYALEIVNLRAEYLDHEDLAAQLAFDPYVFMRNAWLQRRAYLIKINNNPPLRNSNTDTATTDATYSAAQS